MTDLESIKLKSEEVEFSNNVHPKEKSKFKLFFDKKIKYIINKFSNEFKKVYTFVFIFITIFINIYCLYHYLLSLKGCKNSRAYCLDFYSINQLHSFDKSWNWL